MAACYVHVFMFPSLDTLADGQFFVHSSGGGQTRPSFFAQESSVCEKVWPAHGKSVLLQRPA